jgi:DNA-directed RNA polymerase subunit RPC12/RpoP
MAARMEFTCSNCGFKVESWGDGNPYIQDPQGKRHFFYHPCEEEQWRKIVGDIVGHAPSQEEIDEHLQKHSGNEGVFICRKCLETTRLDEDKDTMVCGRCGAKRLLNQGRVAGKVCFSCKKGKFSKGRMTAIS